MIEISVIMGIYNCASTLQEALDSLYSQTFQKFEIIMCDDGSTDNTLNVALENERHHSNVVVLKNDTNMGLNFTLNHCLRYAKGKYIARMDGDDISLPNRLEKEYHFLESHSEYAIVSTAMIYFDEKGVFKIGSVIEKPVNKDIVRSSPFCHAPCMVRKEAYDIVGGYSVSKKFLRVEDLHLWYKMYAKGFKGYNLKEPLYKMRDDLNAIKRRKFKYRINSSYVRLKACITFRLSPVYWFYALTPILVGMLPRRIYKYLHKKF